VLLRLPRSLHTEASEAAERDGTGLNQLVVAAKSDATPDRVAPDRTTRRRIISARRSNDRERESWRKSTGG